MPDLASWFEPKIIDRAHFATGCQPLSSPSPALSGATAVMTGTAAFGEDQHGDAFHCMSHDQGRTEHNTG
jgi:hypothetical protein